MDKSFHYYFYFIVLICSPYLLTGQNSTEISKEIKTPINSDQYHLPYQSQIERGNSNGVYHFETKDFNKGIIRHPLMLIQGKVPGLQIYNRFNNSNARVVVRLRGLNSFQDNSGPRVVVDGNPYAILENLDPKDVKSITVITDGALSALSGSRGYYGLILIQTKNAEDSDSFLNMDIQGGISLISNLLEVADSDQFVELGGLDLGSDTDWISEITQLGTQRTSSASLSDSLFNFASVRFSLHNRNSRGILKKTGFNSWNSRLRIRSSLFDDNLSIDLSGSITDDKRQMGYGQTARYAYTFNPTAPILGENNDFPYSSVDAGGYMQLFGLFDSFNPVAIVNQSRRDHRSRHYEINLSVKGRITEKVDLNFRLSSFSRELNRSKFFNNKSLFEGMILSDDESFKGVSYYNGFRKRGTLAEAFLNYRLTYKGLDAQLIYGLSYYRSNTSSPENTLFRSSEERYLDLLNNHYNVRTLGTNTLPDLENFSNYLQTKLNYRDLLELNLSWRYEEDFVINRGDLLGAHNFGAHTGINLSKMINGNSDYNFNLVGSFSQLNGFPDKNEFVAYRYFGWEHKKEWNLGFNFEFKNLHLSLSRYSKKTSNVLITDRDAVAVAGFTTFDLPNGEINSNGIELFLKYDFLRSKDFKWSSGLNITSFNSATRFDKSAYNDAFTSIGAPNNGGTYPTTTGDDLPIGIFFGPVFEGVNSDGNPVYSDLSGDGKFVYDANPDIRFHRDNAILGYALPSWELGWSNHFSINSWTFSTMIRGAFGHSILNSYRVFYEPSSGTDGANFVLTNKTVEASEKILFSSYHVEKADFIKLDNVSISRTINTPIVKLPIEITLSAQNLLTISNYTGASPEPVLLNSAPTANGLRIPDAEINPALSPGIERRNQYFPNRLISIGVKVHFS